MLNSTRNAFQSNLKLPMRFICMTWPLHNILFKVLDEDSLSWKFTALAIKSKRHKWSSKKFAIWFSSECSAGHHHQVVLFIIADCFAPCVFPSGWCFLSSHHPETSSKEWNSLEAYRASLKHICMFCICNTTTLPIEISDEITMKTAITICVSHFTRPLLWVVLWVWLPCVYYHQSSKTSSTFCL